MKIKLTGLFKILNKTPGCYLTESRGYLGNPNVFGFIYLKHRWILRFYNYGIIGIGWRIGFKHFGDQVVA